MPSDPDKAYFLNSSKNFYTFSLLQNIFIYLVLKMLHLVLYALKRKYHIFKTFYLKIRK